MLNKSNRLSVIAVALWLVFLACPICFGADQGDTPPAVPAERSEATEEVSAPRSDLATGLVAIAAALAVGLPALATGLAQSRIGAAGCGTLAEKPETAGTVILLLAIPETMVILGFVIAIVLLFAV